MRSADAGFQPGAGEALRSWQDNFGKQRTALINQAVLCYLRRMQYKGVGNGMILDSLGGIIIKGGPIEE